MPRTLSAPQNPEFFGRVVSALRLMAQQRPPQNATERDLLAKLGTSNANPVIARRMLGTLDAVPSEHRARLLRSIDDPMLVLPDVAAPTARDRGHGRGGAAETGGTSARHGTEVSGEPATEADPYPDRGPSIRYTIRYVGMFCQEETNGPGSDEIYILTSAVHINDGQNVASDTLRHPLNYPHTHYEDVDSEEDRLGPVAAVWSGNPDTVSLIVTVMEHDYGDPNALRDEIDMAVKAAIAVATKFYPPAALLALVKDFIVDAINWLFDTDDDLISTQTVVLNRADLEAYAGQSPTYHMGHKNVQHLSGTTLTVTVEPLTTRLFQHFVTRHQGDGSDYIIGFDIERDPPLDHNPIIL